MRVDMGGRGARYVLAGSLALALLWCGCGGNGGPEPQDRLVLAGCTHWEQGHLWCGASAFDAQHRPVTGLTLADFRLSESAPGQDARPPSFDSAERFFEDPGFWERSVTADRLDLVFLVDITLTMEDWVAALRPELHDLLDELLARRVDFRLGIVQYDNHFNLARVAPLRGPMDETALRAAIDGVAIRGEWWVPAATFDGLLLIGDGAAVGLGWREGAERVVVSLSDSFSASPYGSDWYTGWCTDASQAAVARLLQARPYRLYYAKPPWAGVEGTDPSNDSYASSETNPKALSLSGLEPFGDELSWPFAATDLVDALDLSATEVVDSVYYFAWESGLDLLRAEGQAAVIGIEISPPDGTFRVEASVPAVLAKGDLQLEVDDPRGGLVSDATALLYRQMGDLNHEFSWDNAVVNGRSTVRSLPEGDYLLRVISDTQFAYEYSELRWFAEQALVWVPGGPAVRLTAAMSDLAAELARARGLLDDIAAWAPADRPFADYAGEARAWLDTLEAGGVDAAGMERLKRYNVGLSGYVNALGYAEAMIDGAVDDFVDAARLLRQLFDRCDEAKDELGSDLLSWDTLMLLGSYLVQLDTDALEKWLKQEAIVELLKSLVLEKLVPKAVEYILDLIRDNVDNSALATDIIQLVIELIYADWDDDPDALKNVVLKIASVALRAILDPVVRDVTDIVKNELRDALSDMAGVEVPEEATEIVRVGLEAIWAGFSALIDQDDDTSFLNAIGARVQAAITRMGDPKNVKTAIAFTIDVLESRCGPGMMRDFVLPLLDMILRTAVDAYGSGDVDEDVVVETLARLFCNYVLIKPYFADPLEAGMEDLLAEAQGFAPGGNFTARTEAMAGDYWNWRGDVMQAANAGALSAMAMQDTFESIDSWLEGAETLLGVAEFATMAACLKYPDFCEAAFEDVPNLISFIRGLRLMTNIIEFALKLDGADDLQETIVAGNPVLWATP